MFVGSLILCAFAIGVTVRKEDDATTPDSSGGHSWRSLLPWNWGSENKAFKAGVDWPSSWPPADDEPEHGPWPKRPLISETKPLEFITQHMHRLTSPMFQETPLIGSRPIPAGPKEGLVVPFPHSIQDAEGLGFLGTADLEKVTAIVPSPWVPVQTTDGKACFASWKDVEKVNFAGQVCQRQWIAFYVTHKDRTTEPVKSPIQLLFGQFVDYIYYTYTYKMYDDCETMVEIDRNFYGWDSVLAKHDYVRDKHGHLKWSVHSPEGAKLMEADLTMPYGVGEVVKHVMSLLKYGTGTLVKQLPGASWLGLGESPDERALHKLLALPHMGFHWVAKPGVMPFAGSEKFSPVILSPFGFFDQPAYPSREAGQQWDPYNYFEQDYYDKDGPFAFKSPMDESDRMVFYDPDITPFNIQFPKEFSLSFYTAHFRMQWNSPWTFVPTSDVAVAGEEDFNDMMGVE